jgi:Arc/MetJ family transcription regulator
MPTNLNIDDKLIAKAQELGGHKTKRDTVNEALREYVLRRERMKIFELAGTIDFDPNYDYKSARDRSAPKKGYRKASGF